MEAEDLSRDEEVGEHVLVEGLLDKAYNLPIIPKSNQIGYYEAVPVKVKYWCDNGHPVIKGDHSENWNSTQKKIFI